MIIINKKIGHTNVSFSPAFYKTALKNYRDGNLRETLALIEAAEIDSHISGCLLGRRAGFLKEWRVSELSNSAADLAAKEFIESIFMGLDMRELFEDIQEARLKKFSVVNLQWDVDSGKQIIVKTEKLNQKYFRYDKDGVLKIDFGDKDLREIPVDSALVSETSRLPILIPVLRDFILKEFGLENWAGFIETFGEGFVIGKYPPGASTEFKTELENAINTLASSSRGIMPDGANIEIKEAQRHTGDHERFVAQSDKGIAISILGHANAVEQTAGLQIGENISSYKVRREIALGDIYFIEQQISRLVRILIDRNFGTGRYPVFSLDKSEPINIGERLEVLRFAWDTGYRIHPDEVAKLGLFKFEDQEPLQKQTVNLLD